MNKRTYLVLIKYIFLVLVLYFVTSFMIRSISELQHFVIQVRYKYLIAAFLLHLVYLISRASIWHYITYINKTHITYIQAVSIWLLSLLGKFIPGKVFYLGARVYHYKNQNRSGTLVSYSFFIEYMTSIVASILIFVISFSFISQNSFQYLKPIGLAVVVLFLIALNPVFVNKFINLLNKHAKREYPLIKDITYGRILIITIMLAVSWMILGTGFYCIINSIYRLPVRYFLYTTGSFALATDIGILALFAPSGIGVREAVIITAMSKITPSGIAAIISIIARIWATSSELFWILIVFILSKILNRNSSKKWFF